MRTMNLTGVTLALGVLLGPTLAFATPPDWESDFGRRYGHTNDSCSSEMLPFAFPFYGTSYTRLWVTSNGTLSFGSCNPTFIPVATPATPVIGVLWADLYPLSTGGVFHQVMGVAPERVFVATWSAVPEYDERTRFNTFQVKLYEGSGRIQFGYDGLGTNGYNGSTTPQQVGLNAGGSGPSMLVASGAAVRALDQTNVCFVPSGSSYTLLHGPCAQDQLAPQVAFAPSPAAYVNTGTLAVSGVATDDTGVPEVVLRLDGTHVSNLSVGARGEVSGSLSFPGEGLHTVSLEAVDAAGNRAVATAQVVYDATEPTVVLGWTPELTSTRELRVTGHVTDASGVASAELMLGGQRFPVTLADDGSVSATLQLQEGPNVLSLVAVDGAGNTRAELTQVALDTHSPQVQLLSPVSGQVLGSSSMELTVSVSDDSAVSASVQGLTRTAGPGTHQLVFPVVIPAEGSASFEVVVQDAAGNPATVASVAVVLDLSVPLLSLERADGQPLQEGDRLGPQPLQGLAVVARVEDLSATRVAFGQGGSYEVPAGGGVVAELVALSEGHNVVEVSAMDEAGRRAVLRRSVVYDVTPPQGVLSVPAAGAVVRGSVELSAQASDNLTGVSAVSFQVDAGPWLSAIAGQADSWDAVLDTTALTDGLHTLGGALQDGVGNTRALSIPFVVDNTAPGLTLAALPAYVRGVVALSAEVSDATSGVSEVVLAVNGVPVHTCAGETLSRCEASFDTATLLNGPFTVTATARDAAGNASPLAERSAIADNLAPARFLVSPTPGATVTTSLQVAVDVRDPGFSRVECVVDGTSLGSSNDPRFSANVDLQQTLDGAVEVRCMAEDRAGNVGIETSTVWVRNWTLTFNPQALNLRSSGAAATLYVEGESVMLLLPVASRDLQLRVPGGASVPVREHSASARVGDHNGNGVPDLTLKLERTALTASIRAGIAAGAIDPDRPVTLELYAGPRALGRDTVTVKP